MQIRLAVQADLKPMVEIYTQAISSGKKTADLSHVTLSDRQTWFDAHTPAKHPILVAVSDETILGYLTLSPYRPGREALNHTAEVSYFVHFDHHRKGIATSLLTSAIDQCPGLKIKSLFAILLDSNPKSVELLAKFGFQQWGHLPRIAEIKGDQFGHLYYGLHLDPSRQSNLSTQ